MTRTVPITRAGQTQPDLVEGVVLIDRATGDPIPAPARTAVADGQYYKVQGSGDAAAFEYRRTNSTTSVLVAEYPSLASFGTNGQTLRHFPSPAVLLSDAGATSLSGGTKNVLALVDAELNALGTNDFNSNADAVSAVNVAEGLQIMVGQIRAAAPNAAIGIIFKDMHTEALVAVRAAMATYGGREAEKLFVLPVFSVLDPYLSYCADQEFVVNSTDAIGVQNITQQDLTHMDSNGREQWAEMTFAFVMNRI